MASVAMSKQPGIPNTEELQKIRGQSHEHIPRSSKYIDPFHCPLGQDVPFIFTSPTSEGGQISQSALDMSSESSSLTFGVEIEFVFAFHQSLLQAHLENVKDASGIEKDVEKDISQETRVNLRLVPQRYQTTRQQYNGWGLKLPTSYSPGEAEYWYQERFAEQLREHGYRGYGNEPLYVAQNAMSSKSTLTGSIPEVYVHDSFRKAKDFEKWQLVNDISLLGLPRPDLVAALGNQEWGDISGTADEWDSHGIELVSRVLPFVEDSFTEVSDYLDVLHGKRATGHRAFLSEFCGLHVHIGHTGYLEQGEQRTGFSLSTLQHLAYILVIYQGAISTLFPPSRRGETGVSGMDLGSNRGKFYKEATYSPGSEDAPDPIYGQVEPEDYQAPMEEDPPDFCFRDVRDLIFAGEQTHKSLADLMCPEGVGRNAIVNFTYTARSSGEGARTVEFRQHEGCLDASGVRWWVKFCAQLVLFAERMASRYGAAQEYDGKGYKWEKWSDEIDIEDLMAEMGFEDGGKTWASEREARFAEET